MKLLAFCEVVVAFCSSLSTEFHPAPDLNACFSQGQERDSYKDLDNSFPIMDLGDKLAAGLGYGLDGSLYAIEGEDGQMTWFNAGVRVGVGIGLGMCLGAGIGIGLMIRTYQATTRTLRKVI